MFIESFDSRHIRLTIEVMLSNINCIRFSDYFRGLEFHQISKFCEISPMTWTKTVLLQHGLKTTATCAVRFAHHAPLRDVSLARHSPCCSDVLQRRVVATCCGMSGTRDLIAPRWFSFTTGNTL